MGLDFEMQIYEHYFEVMDVIEKIFEHIFTGLATRFSASSIPILITPVPLNSVMFHSNRP
jgi:aspartyl/asparaginyl-tRNA synthetase